jgi:hypothetical protein
MPPAHSWCSAVNLKKDLSKNGVIAPLISAGKKDCALRFTLEVSYENAKLLIHSIEGFWVRKSNSDAMLRCVIIIDATDNSG